VMSPKNFFEYSSAIRNNPISVTNSLNIAQRIGPIRTRAARLLKFSDDSP
jgi:hypothetical protein